MPARTVDAPRAIRAGSVPDSFTRSLYACAPYRGCGHGCRYCDGRAEKYYVEGDFERDIEARVNLPDLLAAELPGLRDRGMISFGSGVTDAYQPLEASLEITAKCIPHLIRKGWPTLVITKSSLIERDLSLWLEANRGGGFLLFMTVTGTDERVRELMEPNASGYADRLGTLRRFADAGIPTGALAMPLLPGLNDDEASLRDLFFSLKDAGVSFIMPGGVTLRPGRQKDLYLETLGGARPDLLPYYSAIYAENRQSGAPTAAATTEQRRRYAAVLKETGLSWLPPHRHYARLLPPHDALALLLRDMAELYAARGVAVGPLRAASERYEGWLRTVRTDFRRRRRLPDGWLEERFLSAAEFGELDGLMDNAKLAGFVREVVLKGRRLDYPTLKLEDA